MRYFPFGAAAFSILLLSLVSGSWIALHPPPQKHATLRYWAFAKPHYDAYRQAIPSFEKAHPGVTVDLQLVSNTGLAARLQTDFLADLDVPDLVEVEISPRSGAGAAAGQHPAGHGDL